MTEPKKIGKGVYGTVYQLTENSPTVNKQFKILKGSNTWMTNLVEADVMSQCGDHPNICSLDSVLIDRKSSEKHDRVILVMPKYKTDLQRVINNTTSILTPETIKRFSAHILLGLEYIHSNRFIHRDIKPDNILIDNNKSAPGALICDFGFTSISRKYKKAADDIMAKTHRPPEVWERKKYDSSVDLWGAGVIIYQMLTSRSPFTYPKEKDKEISDKIAELKTEIKTIAATNKSKIPILREQISNLEEELRLIMAETLEKIDIYSKIPHRDKDIKDLLAGLLTYCPKSRITASQALELKYFDSIRKSIIEPVREKFPPSGFQMKLITFENIPEMKWVSEDIIEFQSEYTSQSENTMNIIFHGLDIFLSYLEVIRSSFSPEFLPGTKDEIKGKYMNKTDTKIAIRCALYVSHKYFISSFAENAQKFFPEDIVRNSELFKICEKFEETLVSKVLKYKIYNYSLYETTEEFINNPGYSDYDKILKGFLYAKYGESPVQCTYRDLLRNDFSMTY